MFSIFAITPEQAERVSEEDKRYIYFDGDKRVLVKPPARFVNHSCEPNTICRDCCDVAKRDIKKGEEITEDYSLENNPDLNISCNCGSKNCKGKIK